MFKKRMLSLVIGLVGMVILVGSHPCLGEEVPFGINNPYDYVAPKEKGYLIKPYMDDLGIKWVTANVFRKRVEPKPGSYNWREPDLFVKSIMKDLKIMFNINPKTTWPAKGSIKVNDNTYVPGGDINGESFKVYKAFLKQLVGRYKDNVDHWMICNEPAMEYRPRREDYVKLLKISYTTIKAIDPQATVYLGGVIISIGSERFLNHILPLLSSSHPVFGKENAQYNNYFDGFDIHYYGFYNEYRYTHTRRKRIISMDEVLNLFKKYKLFDGKIRTSRAGATYTGEDFNSDFKGKHLKYQSEEQQAGYLFRRAIYSLSKGIRFYWSQIREREDWKGSANHFFCYQGLVYNGIPKVGRNDKGEGVKKLSYWTYKFLVEKIKETDWKNVSVVRDGTNSDHIFLYKVVKKNGQPLYIAWWNYFDERGPIKTKTITLDVGKVESVKITEAIPDAEWGANLKKDNYPKLFKTNTSKATKGTVSFILGDRPVFVEIAQ